MTEFTAHFRLPVPDFNQEPWHDQFRDLCVAIDNMAYEALLANSSTWANSTPYDVGDIVLDNTNGLLYVCAVTHTSPSTPTTFATFRTSNPTYWNSIAQIPQQRGTWATATTYIVGDFVIDNSRYAVCIVSHVSTTFNADLGTGKWSILIDLSALSVGVNALTEASVTAATTTNLGAVATTQVLVNGTGVTITSFGTTAEAFKIIRFNGSNTITHNATSLILLNGENRTTVVDDVMFLRSNNLGNWRELYTWSRATEVARGAIELATSAETIAGTDNTRATHPQGVAARFDTYFPSGTKLVMNQTTPPPGWTKDVTHNDKALRVVSGGVGSGGTSPFTTVFGKTGTDNFTLTATHIPTHQHDAFVRDDGHQHNLFAGATAATLNAGISWGPGGAPSLGGVALTDFQFTGVKVNSVNSGTAAAADSKTGLTGGGTAHAHTMDIRVQYVDVIVATRI